MREGPLSSRARTRILPCLLTVVMAAMIVLALPPTSAKAATTDVATYDQLANAVAGAADGDTINVTGDILADDGDSHIDVTTSITLTATAGVTIDLYHWWLDISGEGTTVTINGNLTLTNTDSAAKSVVTVTNGAGLIVGGAASIHSEGTVDARGVYLDSGELCAYVDEGASIDGIWFRLYYVGDPSFVPVDSQFLAGLPGPATAALGETSLVELSGVGERAYFQTHNQTPPDPIPGTDGALNTSWDDAGVFSVTPSAVGNLVLSVMGTEVNSNCVYLVIPVTVDSGFDDGDGTADDPFQIADVQQLKRVRDFLGSANVNTYFKLTNNLDLIGQAWEPIGSYVIGEDTMFAGHFDGDGYAISGLTVDRPDDEYAGLFGACSGAEIRDLRILGANVTAKNAGALVGYLTEGSITNCCATGTGTITATEGVAGGLVGAASSSTIETSYATAAVNGANAAGGLAGALSGSGSITDSYAAGDATSELATLGAGGLVGYLSGSSASIDNCYAVGPVSGSGDIGGLVGYKDDAGSTVTASYYNRIMSGTDDDGMGSGLTTYGMVDQDSFSGWDFTSVWAIDEGASYPYLRTMVAPAPRPGPPAATAAAIDSASLTLQYGGDPVALSAGTVDPAAALIYWSSGDTDIATVAAGDCQATVTPVGSGTVTISALSSAGEVLDAVTVEVLPVQLHLQGSFTVSDKPYDGTTAATILTNGLALTDVLGGDDVTLDARAAFADANAGEGKTVSLAGSSLSGAKAANYTLDLTGAPAATADITRVIGLSAPAAPVLVSKTHNCVTLTANAEMEFRVDGGTWQTSSVFAGLSPSTEYVFTARVKADANHEVSPESAERRVTTDAAPSPSHSDGGGSSSPAVTYKVDITQGGVSSQTVTPLGTVTVPPNMLANTPGAEGKTAVIMISEGDKDGLPDSVRAAIGDRPLVQLSLTLDGEQTEWNNPGAPVTIAIPYSPTAAELANPESIVIWYIDGSGNAVCVPNGHYDPATGTVTFRATHFSDYAVAYSQVAFADVAAGEWYSKAVGFIAARGITTGTDDGNYSPEARLTRGQFIVMLMKAYGMRPDADLTDNFADAGDTYYTGYIAAAKHLRISTGVGDNLYAPEQQITRQEMFTLLYNALKVIGQLPQGDVGKSPSDYSDASQVASWANDAITLLVETGAIGGDAGRLNPTGTTTRAEMAQVLYNLLSR